MSILRNVVLSLGTFSIAGGYFLHKEKVSLKNQYLRSLLSFLHNQNQNYSSWLLKEMLYFSMISHCEEVNKYVLAYGFDSDAFLIDGLSEIGFDTIEFGPVSLMPSIKEEKRIHFGNKTAIGNINVFYEKKNELEKEKNQEKQSQKSKIGIAISPNYEVLKYAPYLIEENITSCLKECEELNEAEQELLVDRYVIKLNDPDLIEMKSQEYVAMIQELIKNVHEATLQTFENNKKQFPTLIEKLKRPEIFVEIPTFEQNPEIFKVVKEIPVVEKLIIDGSEYDVSRSVQKINKKTVENVVQLTIGKKRVTFEQLIDKVVNDTL